jgi:hypothetical protein
MRRMLQKLAYLLIPGLLVIAVGCNGGRNQPNIELMDDMMDQINVKAQDWDESAPNFRANKIPPEHTVARDHTPYKYSGRPIEAESGLSNPLKGDFSPKVVELGKGRFDIYCAVCHGPAGLGDGKVGAKMILKPPPLISDKVKAFKDGRIFHIITEGQGLMGSYASQIVDEKARWAIVNYVRTLQRQTNAN